MNKVWFPSLNYSFSDEKGYNNRPLLCTVLFRFDKDQLSNITPHYWKERHAKFEGGFAKSKFGQGKLASELNILKLKGPVFKIIIQRDEEN